MSTSTVTVTYRDGGKDNFENVENVMGATQTYPYWVIWEAPQEDGNQQVSFLHQEVILAVQLLGPPDDNEDKVVSLREVHSDGTV